MRELFLWLIPVAALGVLFFLYFRSVDKSDPPAPEEIAAPAPTAEPAVRYPIETDDQPGPPLPALGESDGTLNDALFALFDQKPPKFLQLKNIVHRIVATVDNLPRDHLATRLLPVKTITGVPVTENVGGSLAFSPRNAARYDAYVRVADTVPTDALVTLYTRFYPLFQQQYEKLGYPDRYFNDRVVDVIDHLLATPEVREPVLLAQPRVLYEFADPKLEALSAGQKILLRVGKENRKKLKSKLQELRQRLASMPNPNNSMPNSNKQ